MLNKVSATSCRFLSQLDFMVISASQFLVLQVVAHSNVFHLVSLGVLSITSFEILL